MFVLDAKFFLPASLFPKSKLDEQTAARLSGFSEDGQSSVGKQTAEGCGI